MKMKKLLCLILVLCMCLSVTAYADTTKAEVKVKIFSDAKKIEADTVMSNNRTLIPIRAVLESTNATLEWDQDTKTASITRNGKTVSVTIGSNIMKTPDGDVTLDTAPVLQNSTTYAPIRAIAEQFGIKVDWDNSGTKTILLTTPDGNPYVDFYNGTTLKDMVDQGNFSIEEFTLITGLNYEELKDKPYSLVENLFPLSVVADMYGVDIAEFKASLTLPEDYPDSAPWGEAMGDVPFGTYVYAFEGLSTSGLSIDESVALIRDSYGLGEEYNANTPFKFVRPILDAIVYEEQIAQQLEAEQQMAKDAEELPSKLEEKLYFTITLSDGSVMKGELYPDLAPITVANFVELVKAKFYDGLIFHRVIDGFMIQGGCYNKSMEPKTSATIQGEFYANGVSNALKHERGVISMARTDDPNSASSQFFIMQEANEYLDGNYAAFGKITKGLEVIDKIAKSETTSNDMGMTDVPVKPIVIKTIRMSR